MKLKKSLVTLASVGALFAASYSYADTMFFRYVYYSDATYNTQVGMRYTNCAGVTTTSGTMTKYRDTEHSMVCYQ